MITFRCDDGSIYECLLPGSHCDEGERAVFEDDDGVERIGVRIVVPSTTSLRTKGIAGHSQQFRKWDPDFKKHTADGCGAWDSQRELSDVIARKRDKGENWAID